MLGGSPTSFWKGGRLCPSPALQLIEGWKLGGLPNLCGRGMEQVPGPIGNGGWDQALRSACLTCVPAFILQVFFLATAVQRFFFFLPRFHSSFSSLKIPQTP